MQIRDLTDSGFRKRLNIIETIAKVEQTDSSIFFIFRILLDI